jgi:hypothetical protein
MPEAEVTESAGVVESAPAVGHGEHAEPEVSDERTEAGMPEDSPFSREPEPPRAVERPRRLTERVSRVPVAQPAEPAAIGAAVSEVEKIVEALKRAAEQMEEVLELVELAERQKLADERELDSLRRALNRLNRSPDGGKHERH